MKKLLIILVALLGFVVAQVDLSSFIGEKLHYDLTFAGSKVAVIDIRIQGVDDSTIGISFNCETIRWAEPIFNEKDSVYTEIDLNKSQFTHSYRLTDWIILGMPDVTEVYLSKQDSNMTYRYEKDVLFFDKNDVLIDEKVVVGKSFSPDDLQEVLSSSMMLRINGAAIGDLVNLHILGSDKSIVSAEKIPIQIEALDTITLGGNKYETIRCSIPIDDDNWLFRQSEVNVWVTNDVYHLPLYGEFAVVDSVGLRVNIDLEKSIIPYWNNTKKQLTTKRYPAP